MHSSPSLGVATVISALGLLSPVVAFPLVSGGAFPAAGTTVAPALKSTNGAWIAPDAVVLQEQGSIFNHGRSLLHGCHYRRCASRRIPPAPHSARLASCLALLLQPSNTAALFRMRTVVHSKHMASSRQCNSLRIEPRYRCCQALAPGSL